MSEPGTTTCEGGCGRQVDPDELIADGDRLVCEPCHAAGVKAADRRDSLDDAIASLRSVARDGVVQIAITLGAGLPTAVDARYHRINEAGPAASVSAHTNPARTLREFAVVIDNLPPIVEVT